MRINRTSNWGKSVKLNVGCGRDKWGDVRVDIGFEYRNGKISPNFIADAQYLPFQENAFSEVKASHIIEELPSWRKALHEWMRVCNNKIIITFPVADGFKRPLILGFLNLSLRAIEDAIKCRKLRCHYWIIDPKIVSDILKQNGFEVVTLTKEYPILQVSGRKGKLLKHIGKYKNIKIEYEIIAKKNS